MEFFQKIKNHPLTPTGLGLGLGGGNMAMFFFGVVSISNKHRIVRLNQSGGWALTVISAAICLVVFLMWLRQALQHGTSQIKLLCPSSARCVVGAELTAPSSLAGRKNDSFLCAFFAGMFLSEAAIINKFSRHYIAMSVLYVVGVVPLLVSLYIAYKMAQSRGGGGYQPLDEEVGTGANPNPNPGSIQ